MTEQAGEIHGKTAHIEKTPVGVQIDQGINITVRPGFVSCNRPKNPDVFCSPPVCKRENFVPFLDELGREIGSRVHIL